MPHKPITVNGRDFEIVEWVELVKHHPEETFRDHIDRVAAGLGLTAVVSRPPTPERPLDHFEPPWM